MSIRSREHSKAESVTSTSSTPTAVDGGPFGSVPLEMDREAKDRAGAGVERVAPTVPQATPVAAPVQAPQDPSLILTGKKLALVFSAM